MARDYGCDVVLVSNQEAELAAAAKDIAAQYGVKTWSLYMDLSKQDAAEQVYEFCKKEGINYLLVNALDRLGRNAFEVLATVKELVDNKINLYMQKEQLTLLDDDGKPQVFTPILICTLSTCAQLERESIQFRLNSGREQYIRNGGKLGRKKGSVKTREQKEKEYKEVLQYLYKGYSIRVTAKLTNISLATVQKLKNEFIRDAI